MTFAPHKSMEKQSPRERGTPFRAQLAVMDATAYAAYNKKFFKLIFKCIAILYNGVQRVICLISVALGVFCDIIKMSRYTAEVLL